MVILFDAVVLAVTGAAAAAVVGSAVPDLGHGTTAHSKAVEAEAEVVAGKAAAADQTADMEEVWHNKRCIFFF